MAGWKGLAKMLDSPRERWISFRSFEVDPEWNVTPCVKVTLDGTFELSELESICEELKRRLNAKEISEQATTRSPRD